MTETRAGQIRSALAQGEAAAAVAKTFDRSVSPDIEGRTAVERVGRFLDVFENKGGSDRESIMGVASRRSNHETVELTVADLRHLTRPAVRVLLTALDEPHTLEKVLAGLPVAELDRLIAFAENLGEDAYTAREKQVKPWRYETTEGAGQ